VGEPRGAKECMASSMRPGKWSLNANYCRGWGACPEGTMSAGWTEPPGTLQGAARFLIFIWMSLGYSRRNRLTLPLRDLTSRINIHVPHRGAISLAPLGPLSRRARNQGDLHVVATAP
jgi:hypothetical protein